MKRIGTYNNYQCYECDIDEYKKYHNDGSLVRGNIYIIDGVMVKDNIIVGYYNGKSVRDDYDGREYMPKVKKPEAAENLVEALYKAQTATSSTTGIEIKEINYSDYTGVVDEFFEKLKIEG